jgi:hypothetical protein
MAGYADGFLTTVPATEHPARVSLVADLAQGSRFTRVVNDHTIDSNLQGFAVDRSVRILDVPHDDPMRTGRFT